MKANKASLPLIAFCLLGTIWGSNFIYMKLAVKLITPLQIVFFRVLFRDAEGKLTGKSWQAHGIGYDRRIPAKGKDTEIYRIPLPGKGEYKVTTRLMYRSMTQESLDEVLQRTGQALPPVVSVEMAAARSTVKF